MTSVEASDVINIAPELSSMDTGLVEFYLELAKNFVNETKWGRKYKQAVCLLTAHFLVIKNREGGSAGPVTSEAVGELSIGYGSVSDKGDELLATTYGSMYFSLRKTLTITPLVV